MEKTQPLITALARERTEQTEVAARDQLGLGMAKVEVEDAVAAAVTGRVERVLVDRIAPPIWGRLDEMTLEVEIHSAPEPGDVDLLDRLVVWARDNGAEIVATESISEGRPFIASLHY